MKIKESFKLILFDSNLKFIETEDNLKQFSDDYHSLVMNIDEDICYNCGKSISWSQGQTGIITLTKSGENLPTKMIYLVCRNCEQEIKKYTATIKFK